MGVGLNHVGKGLVAVEIARPQQFLAVAKGRQGHGCARENRAHNLQHAGLIGAQMGPVLRCLHRRGRQFCEGDAAETAMSLRQPHSHPGRGDGGCADVEFLLGLAKIGHHPPEIHLGGGDLAFRRLDKEVEAMRPPVRIPHHQEPPAEKGGEDGFGDAGGQRPGDRRIHGPAPGAEGKGGGVSGDLVASGDCEFGHGAGYGEWGQASRGFHA